jgi:hypothetical protein
MTSLRDPRLEKALEVAPDAHLRPDARTRQAIIQAASAAVQGQPARKPVAWWQPLWPAGGAGRMPWNAAFATVLLAGFVTLLWQGRPVPDARLDEAAPSAQRTQQAAPPAAQPAEAPATASDAAAPAGTMPPPSVPTAPAQAVRKKVQPPPAAAADPVPVPAPGLAAGNALGRAAPMATPDSPALQGWTELRITQGNQTWRLARADANALAAQVRRLAPTSGEGALPGAVSLRIAFAQGEDVLAELALGEEPWVRWTLLRGGFAGQWTAQADPGQLQTLQIELRRLGVPAR